MLSSMNVPWAKSRSKSLGDILKGALPPKSTEEKTYAIEDDRSNNNNAKEIVRVVDVQELYGSKKKPPSPNQSPSTSSAESPINKSRKKALNTNNSGGKNGRNQVGNGSLAEIREKPKHSRRRKRRATFADLRCIDVLRPIPEAEEEETRSEGEEVPESPIRRKPISFSYFGGIMRGLGERELAEGTSNPACEYYKSSGGLMEDKNGMVDDENGTMEDKNCKVEESNHMVEVKNDMVQDKNNRKEAEADMYYSRETSFAESISTEAEDEVLSDDSYEGRTETRAIETLQDVVNAHEEKGEGGVDHEIEDQDLGRESDGEESIIVSDEELDDETRSIREAVSSYVISYDVDDNSDIINKLENATDPSESDTLSLADSASTYRSDRKDSGESGSDEDLDPGKFTEMLNRASGKIRRRASMSDLYTQNYITLLPVIDESSRRSSMASGFSSFDAELTPDSPALDSPFQVVPEKPKFTFDQANYKEAQKVTYESLMGKRDSLDLRAICASPLFNRRVSLGDVLNTLAPRPSSTPPGTFDTDDSCDDSHKSWPETSSTNNDIKSAMEDTSRESQEQVTGDSTVERQSLVSVLKQKVQATLRRRNSIASTKPWTGTLENSLRASFDLHDRREEPEMTTVSRTAVDEDGLAVQNVNLLNAIVPKPISAVQDPNATAKLKLLEPDKARAFSSPNVERNGDVSKKEAGEAKKDTKKEWTSRTQESSTKTGSGYINSKGFGKKPSPVSPAQGRIQNGKSSSTRRNSPKGSPKVTTKKGQYSDHQQTKRKTPLPSQEQHLLDELKNSPKASRTSSPNTSFSAPSKVTANASPKMSLKTASRASPKTTQKAMPKSAPKTLQKATLSESPKSSREVTPNASRNATPKSTPFTSPKATPKSTPNVSPKTLRKATPKSTPNTSRNATPKSTPFTSPKATPKSTPNASPKTSRKQTLKSTPMTSPKTTAKRTAKSTPRTSPSMDFSKDVLESRDISLTDKRESRELESEAFRKGLHRNEDMSRSEVSEKKTASYEKAKDVDEPVRKTSVTVMRSRSPFTIKTITVGGNVPDKGKGVNWDGITKLTEPKEDSEGRYKGQGLKGIGNPETTQHADLQRTGAPLEGRFEKQDQLKAINRDIANSASHLHDTSKEDLKASSSSTVLDKELDDFSALLGELESSPSSGTDKVSATARSPVVSESHSSTKDVVPTEKRFAMLSERYASIMSRIGVPTGVSAVLPANLNTKKEPITERPNTVSNLKEESLGSSGYLSAPSVSATADITYIGENMDKEKEPEESPVASSGPRGHSQIQGPHGTRVTPVVTYTGLPGQHANNAGTGVQAFDKTIVEDIVASAEGNAYAAPERSDLSSINDHRNTLIRHPSVRVNDQIPVKRETTAAKETPQGDSVTQRITSAAEVVASDTGVQNSRAFKDAGSAETSIRVAGNSKGRVNSTMETKEDHTQPQRRTTVVTQLMDSKFRLKPTHSWIPMVFKRMSKVFSDPKARILEVPQTMADFNRSRSYIEKVTLESSVKTEALSIRELLRGLREPLLETELIAICKECTKTLRTLDALGSLPSFLSLDTVVINPSGTVKFKHLSSGLTVDELFLAPENKNKFPTEKTCVFGLAVTLWLAADWKLTEAQKPSLSSCFQELLWSMTQDEPAVRPGFDVILQKCESFHKEGQMSSRERCQTLLWEYQALAVINNREAAKIEDTLKTKAQHTALMGSVAVAANVKGFLKQTKPPTENNWFVISQKTTDTHEPYLSSTEQQNIPPLKHPTTRKISSEVESITSKTQNTSRPSTPKSSEVPMMFAPIPHSSGSPMLGMRSGEASPQISAQTFVPIAVPVPAVGSSPVWYMTPSGMVPYQHVPSGGFFMPVEPPPGSIISSESDFGDTPEGPEVRKRSRTPRSEVGETKERMSRSSSSPAVKSRIPVPVSEPRPRVSEYTRPTIEPDSASVRQRKITDPGHTIRARTPSPSFGRSGNVSNSTPRSQTPPVRWRREDLDRESYGGRTPRARQSAGSSSQPSSRAPSPSRSRFATPESNSRPSSPGVPGQSPRTGGSRPSSPSSLGSRRSGEGSRPSSPVNARSTSPVLELISKFEQLSNEPLENSKSVSSLLTKFGSSSLLSEDRLAKRQFKAPASRTNNLSRSGPLRPASAMEQNNNTLKVSDDKTNLSRSWPLNTTVEPSDSTGDEDSSYLSEDSSFSALERYPRSIRESTLNSQNKSSLSREDRARLTSSMEDLYSRDDTREYKVQSSTSPLSKHKSWSSVESLNSSTELINPRTTGGMRKSLSAESLKQREELRQLSRINSRDQSPVRTKGLSTSYEEVNSFNEYNSRFIRNNLESPAKDTGKHITKTKELSYEKALRTSSAPRRTVSEGDKNRTTWSEIQVKPVRDAPRGHSYELPSPPTSDRVGIPVGIAVMDSKPDDLSVFDGDHRRGSAPFSPTRGNSAFSFHHPVKDTITAPLSPPVPLSPSVMACKPTNYFSNLSFDSEAMKPERDLNTMQPSSTASANKSWKDEVENIRLQARSSSGSESQTGSVSNKSNRRSSSGGSGSADSGLGSTRHSSTGSTSSETQSSSQAYLQRFERRLSRTSSGGSEGEIEKRTGTHFDSSGISSNVNNRLESVTPGVTKTRPPDLALSHDDTKYETTSPALSLAKRSSPTKEFTTVERSLDPSVFVEKKPVVDNRRPSKPRPKPLVLTGFDNAESNPSGDNLGKAGKSPKLAPSERRPDQRRGSKGYNQSTAKGSHKKPASQPVTPSTDASGAPVRFSYPRRQSTPVISTLPKPQNPKGKSSSNPTSPGNPYKDNLSKSSQYSISLGAAGPTVSLVEKTPPSPSLPQFKKQMAKRQAGPNSPASSPRTSRRNQPAPLIAANSQVFDFHPKGISIDASLEKPAMQRQLQKSRTTVKEREGKNNSDLPKGSGEGNYRKSTSMGSLSGAASSAGSANLDKKMVRKISADNLVGHGCATSVNQFVFYKPHEGRSDGIQSPIGSKSPGFVITDTSRQRTDKNAGSKDAHATRDTTAMQQRARRSSSSEKKRAKELRDAVSDKKEELSSIRASHNENFNAILKAARATTPRNNGPTTSSPLNDSRPSSVLSDVSSVSLGMTPRSIARSDSDQSTGSLEVSMSPQESGGRSGVLSDEGINARVKEVRRRSLTARHDSDGSTGSAGLPEPALLSSSTPENRLSALLNAVRRKSLTPRNDSDLSNDSMDQSFRRRSSTPLNDSDRSIGSPDIAAFFDRRRKSLTPRNESDLSIDSMDRSPSPDVRIASALAKRPPSPARVDSKDLLGHLVKKVLTSAAAKQGPDVANSTSRSPNKRSPSPSPGKVASKLYDKKEDISATRKRSPSPGPSKAPQEQQNRGRKSSVENPGGASKERKPELRHRESDESVVSDIQVNVVQASPQINRSKVQERVTMGEASSVDVFSTGAFPPEERARTPSETENKKTEVTKEIDVLDKLMEMIHEEFSIDGYLDDGVEDVNMAEYVMSLSGMNEEMFKEAVSDQYGDLYWDDDLLEEMYQVVTKGLRTRRPTLQFSESTVSDYSVPETPTSSLSREGSELGGRYLNTLSRTSSDRSSVETRDFLMLSLGEPAEFLPFRIISPEICRDINEELAPFFEDYHKVMKVKLAPSINELTDRLGTKILEIGQQLTLERRAKKKNVTSFNKVADIENKKDVKDLATKLLQEIEESDKKIIYLKYIQRRLRNIYAERFGLDHSLLYSFTTSYSQDNVALEVVGQNNMLSFSPMWDQRGADTAQAHGESIRGPMLQYGTMEGLFSYLFGRYAMSQAYMRFFLYTFRYCATPMEVFNFIREKCRGSLRAVSSESGLPFNHQLQIRYRALDVMAEWVDCCYNFDLKHDLGLLGQLVAFIQDEFIPVDRTERGNMMIELIAERQRKDQEEEAEDTLDTVAVLQTDDGRAEGSGLPGIRDAAKKLNPKRKNKANVQCFKRGSPQAASTYKPTVHLKAMSVNDHSSRTVAQQLTLIQQELFTRAHSIHFLNSRILGVGVGRSSPTKEATSQMDNMLGFSAGRRRSVFSHDDQSSTGGENNLFVGAPNKDGVLEAMLEHAQDVSMWVAVEICSAASVKSQLVLITKFISVAKHCAEMRNFATCVQIVDALDMFVIKQLPVWKQVPNKVIQSLDELKAIKVLLKTDSTWLLRDEAFREKPTIPCTLLFLMHIQQLEIGGFTLANGMYKWTKMRSIGRLVDQIRLFKQMRYAFEANDSLKERLVQRIHECREQNLHALASENATNFHLTSSQNSRKFQDAFKKMKATFGHG